MKERPVVPLLLSMALPMVISMMVNSLYNIVDSFFVAKISEDAMTALSLVFPVQNFINAVGIGFGVGINAVIALYLGEGNEEKADKAATQGLVCAAVHSVIMTAGSIGGDAVIFEGVYVVRGSAFLRHPLFANRLFVCSGDHVCNGI